ncbi:hypothetical protein [Methanosarcina acetivorans]|uniref:Uncharacterized protein n=1 Tax=Methanosarcina acetivorans (strain ATCC 35395 / DSM 2834 / JCM 12185 / C2A) TaxID=188937 RepID=Q8TTE3_METAC|nr:hypothetical protein [Methanosarcina acetivorans]AAM03938.1 predicted protein [Methanosarcina acetivorans C2A]
MSRKKIQITFVIICLLLVSIIIFTSFVKHYSLFDKKESGNSFFIINWGNKSHEITVEVFNSKKTSIFNESYISDPKKDIESQFPFRLESGTYIEVTLDNNITKTQIISEDASDVVLYIDIDRYPDDLLVLGIAIP